MGSSDFAVLGILFWLFRKKIFDYVIITKEYFFIIYSNKIKIQHRFNRLSAIEYNGIEPSIKIYENEKITSYSLLKFKISYEEGEILKKKILELNQKFIAP